MEMLVFQFVTIPSYLFTGCHWEDSVFFTPSPFQVFIHNDKVLSESPLLQSKVS